MKRLWTPLLLAAALTSANAQDTPTVAGSGPACEAFGPQTPRDIDVRDGQNPQAYRLAPPYQEMNLCNIHFHRHAEHKAKAFAIYAGEGEDDHGGGYQCGISKALSAAELKAPDQEICKGLKPGDTIEVHWVHSSCQVKPGEGLGACSSDKCANPELRVEAQVFTLVNDPAALKFGDFGYGGNVVGGRHQAKAIPTKTGKPVEFRLDDRAQVHRSGVLAAAGHLERAAQVREARHHQPRTVVQGQRVRRGPRAWRAQARGESKAAVADQVVGVFKLANAQIQADLLSKASVIIGGAIKETCVPTATCCFSSAADAIGEDHMSNDSLRRAMRTWLRLALLPVLAILVLAVAACARDPEPGTPAAAAEGERLMRQMSDTLAGLHAFRFTTRGEYRAARFVHRTARASIHTYGHGATAQLTALRDPRHGARSDGADGLLRRPDRGASRQAIRRMGPSTSARDDRRNARRRGEAICAAGAHCRRGL